MIRNAKIKSTFLGYEDHGILTLWLNLDYGGIQQSFGGYALDEPIKDEAGKFMRRECTSLAGKSISKILKVVGVEKWEDLPGEYIRADSEHSGISRIGNLLEEEWFSWNELFEGEKK